MKLLGSYINGNINVKLYSDGTKERITEDDEFITEFPECADVCISTYCQNNCGFCYANCSSNGKDADLKSIIESGFFDNIHPYTELAINFNSDFDSNETLPFFLEYMKSKKVVVNATVNQKDFLNHYDKLLQLSNEKLIWGLGVSLSEVSEEFIIKIKDFSNAIIHIINGIVTPDQIKALADNDLKILILGYKHIGRGISNYKEAEDLINKRQQWIDNNLEIISRKFKVVSFDNLALEQLNVRRLLTEEEWGSFYLGDDGTSSFYVDLVNKYYARNSLGGTKYPIENDINECFKHMKEREVIK